ncbi:hypothetical protein BDZ91DRAFT_715405 [Kalaharituber pfeilii]|nr:hypothetical protein BDZ91DRAFT_715405 [Kalaharituber pfeilii]
MSDKQNINTPVVPSKETIEAGVFDRGSSSSGSGDRTQHSKARPEHFQAAPGPVLPRNMSVFEGKPSKEEIKAKTEALNKENDRAQ